MTSSLHALIGNRIRVTRYVQGRRLLEVARVANLTRSYLSKIERGKRDVTLPTLARIAGALGLSLPELFVAIKSDQSRVDLKWKEARNLSQVTTFQQSTTASRYVN